MSPRPVGCCWESNIKLSYCWMIYFFFLICWAIYSKPLQQSFVLKCVEKWSRNCQSCCFCLFICFLRLKSPDYGWKALNNVTGYQNSDSMTLFGLVELGQRYVAKSVKCVACLPCLGQIFSCEECAGTDRGSLPEAVALRSRLHSIQKLRWDHQLLSFSVIWTFLEDGGGMQEGMQLLGLAKFKPVKVCAVHH